MGPLKSIQRGPETVKVVTGIFNCKTPGYKSACDKFDLMFVARRPIHRLIHWKDDDRRKVSKVRINFFPNLSILDVKVTFSQPVNIKGELYVLTWR